MKLFTKGMRVYVEGNMRLETWADSSEGAKSEMRISANKVLIDPICLESVTRRKNDKPSPETMAEELEEQAAA
jgi:single-stranded DNA-binding protein